jgi:gamma-glutamylcyclotransferase
MILVFQYGSNCLESQINSVDRLCGDARFVGIAQTVEEFRLSFDVWSKGRSCAAANIVPFPGCKVWGALYELPEYLLDRETAKVRNRKSLDAIEGRKYRREPITVQLPNGELLTCVTYRVIEPEAGLKTSFEYVAYIVKGLRERGVPTEYIAAVKNLAASNNPVIATRVGEL